MKNVKIRFVISGSAVQIRPRAPSFQERIVISFEVVSRGGWVPKPVQSVPSLLFQQEPSFPSPRPAIVRRALEYIPKGQDVPLQCPRSQSVFLFDSSTKLGYPTCYWGRCRIWTEDLLITKLVLTFFLTLWFLVWFLVTVWKYNR